MYTPVSLSVETWYKKTERWLIVFFFFSNIRFLMLKIGFQSHADVKYKFNSLCGVFQNHLAKFIQ